LHSKRSINRRIEQPFPFAIYAKTFFPSGGFISIPM